MTLQDKFGNTPLHYAAMAGKTYCFLYLKLTLSENFNMPAFHGTLMHFAGIDDSKEIVLTMMHDPDLRPWVLQALFIYALQKANVKLIKIILRQAYKEIADVIWT